VNNGSPLFCAGVVCGERDCYVFRGVVEWSEGRLGLFD